MRRHLIIGLTLSLLFTLIALAEEPGWVVEATGRARIIEGNVEAAKAQAERDALRNALQYQIGVNIKSRTVVHNAELVSDVVDAHVEGYARKLGYIERPHPDPENPGYIRVKLKVWVSPNIHEVMEKLSNPRVIFVGVKVKTEDLDERLSKLARDKLHSTLRSTLIEAGYGEERKDKKERDEGPYIPWLTEKQVERVRRLIEKLADASVPREERVRSASQLWSIGLGELADLFLVGEMTFSMRGADVPGGGRFKNLRNLKVVNLDGNLQVLRLDPEREVVKLIDERWVEERAIQKADTAVRLVVDDVKPKIEELISELQERMGPPDRTVVLYVKGLKSLDDYRDFQEKLSQYEPYGVEKVRGVIFDKVMSKFILTFSKQALVGGDLPQRVRYLATVIDQSPIWRVVKTATRTMMIERVNP
jgi:hypothetical protein